MSDVQVPGDSKLRRYLSTITRAYKDSKQKGQFVEWVAVVGLSRLFKRLGPPRDTQSGKPSRSSRFTTKLVEAGSKIVYPDFGQVIVLEPYRGIYFAIPKVANSSLKTFFAERLGLEGEAKHRNGKAYLFNDIESRQMLLSKGVLVTRALASQKSDYWKFAFVRNPWGRLVSFYSSAVVSPNIMGTLRAAYGEMFWPDMPFEAFVKSVCDIPDLVSNLHFISQYHFVVDRRGETIPDFIGRFETLEEDFQHVCKTLGIENASISNVNPGKYQASYRDYYTDASRDAVAKRYEKDIALFDYRF